MSGGKNRQTLYIYVDESGQDSKSRYFVVGAVVTERRLEMGERLERIEADSETHGLKWHKSSNDRRVAYLSMVLRHRVCAGDVYVYIQ